MTRRAFVRTGFLLGALVECGAASASPSPAEKATAEALFEQGRALLEAERTKEACEKFAASEELDSGIGTLLFLGDCYERLGKTASAWATFKQAWSVAEATGQPERARIAAVRAQAVSAQLSKVVIVVSDEVADANPEIRRNGVRVPFAAWGEETPVDPGEHRIEVRLADGRSWARVFEIPAETSTTRIEAELPAPAPGARPTPAPPAAPRAEPGPPDATKAQGADARVQAETGSTQRLLGWITAGVGLAGIGAGSYFGVRAINDKSASDSVCRTETLCSEEGVALRESAVRSGNISTLAFGVGGALVAGGVILVWTAPSDAAAEARSSLRLTAAPRVAGAHVGLEGAW